MNARTLLALGLAGCLGLGGCSVLPVAMPMVRKMANEAKTRTPAVPDVALEAVKPGITTRDELKLALGDTHVVRFDSGFEVWVYRMAMDDARQQAEFVVLVAPSGVVAKTRVRMPPMPAVPAETSKLADTRSVDH